MIYFLGDVHGRIDHVLPALSARQDTAAHAIFLGDIDFRQPFEEEIRPLIDAGIQVWNPNSQAKDNSLPLLRSYDDYIDRQKSKT